MPMIIRHFYIRALPIANIQWLCDHKLRCFEFGTGQQRAVYRINLLEETLKRDTGLHDSGSSIVLKYPMLYDVREELHHLNIL